MGEIDLGLVNWSRAQFALTAMYHWIFVPLTLGLSFLCAFFESIYVKTGKEEWRHLTRFWMTLFGINFAIGVATGIILEFEFGTNWSNYSWMVGDIFGAPLAIEGIVAFFLEATFFAVMFFGWERVSKRMHLFSTWMVAFGSNLSALWILIANAWMQHPVGYTIRNGRAELTDFWAVVLNKFALLEFLHTVSAAFLLSCFFVMGVSAYHLLKRNEIDFFYRSFRIAMVFGIVTTLFVGLNGDWHGVHVAETQPAKLVYRCACGDRIGLATLVFNIIESGFPAFPDADIETFVNHAAVCAHQAGQQDVADPVVDGIFVRHPGLLHQPALEPELGSHRRYHAGVIGLHAADGDQGVGA